MTTKRLARAKINLALHVTGQRTDGYHILDSLVCFADIGDVVSATAANALSLSVTGPKAAEVPLGGDNLVLKTARCFGASYGAAIELEKHLPAASGIGGGSADAAAALHVLAGLWRMDMPDLEAQLALGADVPVCVASETSRMQGIGEVITPVRNMPVFEAVLVNPGAALSTPQVFRALASKENASLSTLPANSLRADWVAYLDGQRNDLEAAAISLAPSVQTVLTALSDQPECDLVRMSGSGATCFGLFGRARAAQRAAEALRLRYPDWWIKETRLG